MRDLNRLSDIRNRVFHENTSLHPAESEKNPVSLELRMGLRNRVFYENTSLHSAESEKNPVSLAATGIAQGLLILLLL